MTAALPLKGDASSTERGGIRVWLKGLHNANLESQCPARDLETSTRVRRCWFLRKKRAGEKVGSKRVDEKI